MSFECVGTYRPIIMLIETEKEINVNRPPPLARDRPPIQSIYSTSWPCFSLFMIIQCGYEIAIHSTPHEILIDFFFSNYTYRRKKVE